MMKRRHIEAAGYIVINIPHWQLRPEAGHNTGTQEKVLKNSLLKIGLRFKV